MTKQHMFIIENNHQKATLDDNPDHVVKDDDLSFQILVGGSLRGKCKLKDSRGYTYTVKAEKGEKTWWRCSKRSGSIKCPATVNQIGDNFLLGKYPHEHPAQMKRLSRKGIQDYEEDLDNSYDCSPLDESIEEQNLDATPESKPKGPTLKVIIDSPASKKRKVDSFTGENNVQDELINIEKERLKVDKQRLSIERQRFEVEKQRLEETKKLIEQCTCMNRDAIGVLVQKNF